MLWTCSQLRPACWDCRCPTRNPPHLHQRRPSNWWKFRAHNGIPVYICKQETLTVGEVHTYEKLMFVGELSCWVLEHIADVRYGKDRGTVRLSFVLLKAQQALLNWRPRNYDIHQEHTGPPLLGPQHPFWPDLNFQQKVLENCIPAKHGEGIALSA